MFNNKIFTYIPSSSLGNVYLACTGFAYFTVMGVIDRSRLRNMEYNADQRGKADHMKKIVAPETCFAPLKKRTKRHTNIKKVSTVFSHPKTIEDFSDGVDSDCCEPRKGIESSRNLF